MKNNWRVTIGRFHPETKQLITFFEAESFVSYRDAKAWAISRVGDYFASARFNIEAI